MEGTDVRRLGLILSIQAEIEGMKAENTQREQCEDDLKYTDADFQVKAEDLRNTVCCHDDNL